MKLFLSTSAALLASAVAQQAGTLTTETHPDMPMKTCDKSGNCKTESTKLVLDANWRWLHKTGDSTNCYTGNTWDSASCPDNKACAQNCALDGADYSGSYGVKASGGEVAMTFVTKHNYGTNIGTRLYLMESDTKYKMFKLLNKEFAFDVDVSALPCGINGALYFVEMEADGGMAKNSGNKAGAKYGTGYCDAQCPRDIKFINGEANVEGWQPSDGDKNAGKGDYGSCCPEMDIWESNTNAQAHTTHPCKSTGLVKCKGEADCGQGEGNRYKGQCDMDGCDSNPYRLGDKKFYGKGSGFKIDSSKKMTVVTQFITTDGTDNGDLKRINRIYVQNGKVVNNTKINIPSVAKNNYIDDKTCTSLKNAFGDQDDHKAKGGFKQMGKSLKNGMVLALSIWDDHTANCLWLDSVYPVGGDKSKPGVERGSCPVDSGKPADVEANYPSAVVKYSNIKVGPIGSTYKKK